MKILAIIPAKTDSVRLPKKNLQKINGKTLVEHSIEYALDSKYDVDIVVSTEDYSVESDVYDKCINNHNVWVDIRDDDMCGDTEVVDVYLAFVDKIEDPDQYTLVVALQPDHPNRQHTFDECVGYFVDNNYDDLITIEENYKRSGSVRIFKMEHLLNGHVSKRIGTMVDSAVDIHYKEDLDVARERMKSTT